MPKNMQPLDLTGLELCQKLVQDHGDALRFSLSKKGRIWLTFTHWDNEKYNTSVELGAFDGIQELLDAFSVLGVAHYAKCFKGVAHVDSWTGVDATRALVVDCRAQSREYLVGASDNVEETGPDTAS